MSRFDSLKDDAKVWALDARDKAEDLVSRAKLTEYLHKQEKEDEQKTCILWIFAVIGAVAAIAAIAFAVYKFVSPDYLEDYDDYDFDDDDLTDPDVVDEEKKPEKE